MTRALSLPLRRNIDTTRSVLILNSALLRASRRIPARGQAFMVRDDTLRLLTMRVC